MINRPAATLRAIARTILGEQEGVYLYRMLAEAERDSHLAELYRRLADIEQRHSDLWKGYLTAAGETPPTYTPNWRIRGLVTDRQAPRYRRSTLHRLLDGK